MNDRSNNYSTHSDLLVQVADSAEEDAHVRRVLGARVSEAELDEYEQWRRAPFPIGATNHAHRYSACKSGPCEQGRKPCPSTEACQCSEPDNRAERAITGLVTFTVAALVCGAVAAVVLIVMGVKL